LKIEDEEEERRKRGVIEECLHGLMVRYWSVNKRKLGEVYWMALQTT
jgi:hypothetical protein